MKKKISFLMITISSFSFFLINANATYFDLLCFAFIGAFFGMVLNRCIKQKYICKNIILLLISFSFSLYLVYMRLYSFYNTWSLSSKLNAILGLVFADTRHAIEFISIVLSIISFPFLFVAISTFLMLIINAIRSIVWKRVFDIDIKKLIKKSIFGILYIILASIMGLFLLTCSYMLPTTNIIKNVSGSAIIMNREGNYPKIVSCCTSTLDNFTDSLMLLESASESKANNIDKSLLSFRGCIDYEDPLKVLTLHFIDEIEYTHEVEYSRYWHGYRLFINPLLEFMDYGGIRILNGVMQVLLVTFTCVLMKRKKIAKFIFPYIVSYLLLMPIALAMSFQFSSCFYVMSFGIIFVLLLPEKARKRYSWFLFLNVGILTSYFDLLTYPIATFGVPAVFYLAITDEDTEEKLKTLLKISFAWCAGYGCMWLLKWVLTSIFTSVNVFEDAIASFKMRTSSYSPDGSVKYSIYYCILNNINAFLNTPIKYIVIVYIMFSSVNILKKHDDLEKGIFPYFVISLLPIVWYVFALNHSSIHIGFTNKACVVMIISIMFCLTEYATTKS